MKITQIPMGTHNAQLTCYLQDPCTEMPALDRCPAILIFPGGAYAFCSDREADPVALAFLNAGYNAFVLRYSVSQNCPVEEVYTNAFAEAQEAMDYLHQNAGDLHIDPEQIAVVGFSAGGHLAASVGTMGRVRPAAMLLGYAVFSVPGKALGMELPDLLQQVDDQTPPAFLFATQGDHLVPATQSLQFATLLAERKIPYEMHLCLRRPRLLHRQPPHRQSPKPGKPGICSVAGHGTRLPEPHLQPRRAGARPGGNQGILS